MAVELKRTGQRLVVTWEIFNWILALFFLSSQCIRVYFSCHSCLPSPGFYWLIVPFVPVYLYPYYDNFYRFVSSITVALHPFVSNHLPNRFNWHEDGCSEYTARGYFQWRTGKKGSCISYAKSTYPMTIPRINPIMKVILSPKNPDLFGAVFS